MTANPEVLLFTPGPTRVPPQVQAEISKPIIHHRSSEFETIFGSLRNNLHLITQTDGESVVLTASGTAAMEATIASLFSPSDHVVIVDSGKFGQRWVELAHRYRLSFTVIQKPWGKTVTPEDIMSHVFTHTKGVLIQACESSTGVDHPIEEIGKALKSFPDLLFVVDAIMAIGVRPLSIRQHRIDALVGASQKGLMCPPGLSLVVLSQRALSQVRTSTQPMYLSLNNELQTQVKNKPMYTPAVSLVRGLEKATEMILTEGLKEVHERHKRLQHMTRGFFKALGLQCFAADEDAALAVTAVRGLQGLNVEKWLVQLRKEQGLWLASGQMELKTAIFRMAHMGYCSEKDLKHALGLIMTNLQRMVPVHKAQNFLNSI
jgi:aspartate aminotransferase-like enzyme